MTKLRVFGDGKKIRKTKKRSVYDTKNRRRSEGYAEYHRKNIALERKLLKSKRLR